MKGASFLSGIAMLVLVVAGMVGAFVAMPDGAEKAGRYGWDNALNGQWTLPFERAFDEAMPHRETSLSVWGVINWVGFHQGRVGVLVGDGGWLFTKEEYDWPKHRDAELQIKRDYIRTVAASFKEKGIALVVAPIPAKARVCASLTGKTPFPSYNQPVYGDLQAFLKAEGIVAVDVMAAYARTEGAPTNPCTENFLRTDTHWTPKGAERAAQAIAETVKAELPKLKLTKTAFTTAPAGEALVHSGDLLRYVPLGALQDSPLGIEADSLQKYETKAPESKGDDLFADAEIPVALVGTSYSANPLWNFDGFLKTALEADVLNAADPGRGPFVTMRDYLTSEALKTTPPKLVIWEIPERFLTVHYDLDGSNG